HQPSPESLQQPPTQQKQNPQPNQPQRPPQFVHQAREVEPPHRNREHHNPIVHHCPRALPHAPPDKNHRRRRNHDIRQQTRHLVGISPLPGLLAMHLRAQPRQQKHHPSPQQPESRFAAPTTSQRQSSQSSPQLLQTAAPLATPDANTTTATHRS